MFYTKVENMNSDRDVLSSKIPESGEGNEGFTLLEVLIAVVILGLSYVAILESFSLSMRNIARIEKELTTDFSGNSRFFSAALYEGEVEEPNKEEMGQTYLIGHKYKLVEITSEDGELKTLKLDKL